MRDKIIQEALKIFSMKGFQATSISDIMEAVRICYRRRESVAKMAV